jgi:hypothetical protein
MPELEGKSIVIRRRSSLKLSLPETIGVRARPRYLLGFRDIKKNRFRYFRAIIPAALACVIH